MRKESDGSDLPCEDIRHFFQSELRISDKALSLSVSAYVLLRPPLDPSPGTLPVAPIWLLEHMKPVRGVAGRM